MITRRRLCSGAVLSFAPVAARAGLSPPRGPVLLTVRGRVALPNAGQVAKFDREMLEALPQGRFYGPTPWTRGDTLFTGPLLAAVLDAAGARGESLEVAALNDYVAVIPMSDLHSYEVILATRRGGAPMTLRDKGPLWVIYPMDADPALRNEAIYARSVWQVASIVVA